MSVAPEVSRAIVQAELDNCSHYFGAFGWELTSNLDDLTFRVRMKSRLDNEVYVVDFQCDNYKEIPPLIDFVDPSTGAKGTVNSYPDDRKSGNAIMHSQGPCICLQCNRKAYSTLGGPHNDWQMASWVALRPELAFLGDMLKKIWDHINDPEKYKGRMK